MNFRIAMAIGLGFVCAVSAWDSAQADGSVRLKITAIEAGTHRCGVFGMIENNTDNRIARLGVEDNAAVASDMAPNSRTFDEQLLFSMNAESPADCERLQAAIARDGRHPFISACIMDGVNEGQCQQMVEVTLNPGMHSFQPSAARRDWREAQSSAAYVGNEHILSGETPRTPLSYEAMLLGRGAIKVTPRGYVLKHDAPCRTQSTETSPVKRVLSGAQVTVVNETKSGWIYLANGDNCYIWSGFLADAAPVSTSAMLKNP